MMRGSVRLIAVLLPGALFLGGCGGDEPLRDASPAEEPPAENVVDVAATEYAYSMPGEIEGGVVTFRFVNNGEEPHEFAFARLSEGRSADDLAEAFLAREDTEWAEDMAGVPLLGAGNEVGMSRELEAGRYAFFCMLPTPDLEPHLAHGMIVEFEVVGDAGAELPEADGVISVTDDGFEIPELPSGRTIVELRNDGTEDHEFALYALEEGKKVSDIDKWFGRGMKGPAPALFPGGMQSIPPGTSVTLHLDLEAGKTYTIEDFGSKLKATFIPG